MRLGNKGSKSLRVRRVVLSVLYASDPDTLLDVEEVAARAHSIEGELWERIILVRKALSWLGCRGLIVGTREPKCSRKWWGITEVGRDFMSCERAAMEQEAESFVDKPVLTAPL